MGNDDIFATVNHKEILSRISIILNLLVGYHVSNVLIGYAPRRLLVIAY
jgi:hypothetical protein